jgi:hypothetical protein
VAVYTPAEFVGKLGELNAAGAAIPGLGIRPAAELVASAIMAAAPKRLRGVGRGGASLGARVTVNAASFGEASADVRPVGPFQLIEHDTRPHQIPREGNVGRKWAVFGGNVYSRVDHPGTHGQHIWEHASIAAAPAVERLYGRENETALQRVF